MPKPDEVLATTEMKGKSMNNQIRISKQIEQLKLKIAAEAHRRQLESVLVMDIRELFECNGARNLVNLHTIAPISNEKTIFLSRAIRLQPWLKDLRTKYDPSDQNQSLLDALREVIGSKHA